jgi:hypothetical protein
LKREKNLREFVQLDLHRAQRLIARVGDEIDPQFRIASPDGDYWIAITLSKKADDRLHQLELVSRFMAWKLSPGFTLASELYEPDSVFCIGVTYKETYATISRIIRTPLKFGPIEWLAPETCDDAIVGLLPKGQRSLDHAEIAELENYFGVHGKFPAILIR